MLNVFIGTDSRTNLDSSVCSHSIHKKASKPVAVTYLQKQHFPTLRTGLTEFTFSRFLCPMICDYKGFSVFVDSDFVFLNDINLLTNFIEDAAVAFVPFEGELTFERTSLMIFNNELCKKLTLDYINNKEPFDLSWADKKESIHPSWNFLEGYNIFGEDDVPPNAIHYTRGSPQFAEMRDCDFNGRWFQTKQDMLKAPSWLELHGRGVHAQSVLNDLQEKIDK